MASNTVIEFQEKGDPSVLSYVKRPLPIPGEGEVRIRVLAIRVGFGECLYRRGFYPQETKVPGSLGNHAVGVIDALGANVNLKVGEKVGVIPSFEMNTYTVYSKFAIIPAFSVAPYFENLSLEENASLWMQIVTAYGALVRFGKLTKNEYVIVSPGSGGVGTAALQIIKTQGAISIATTRSEAKARKLKEKGANHVVVTSGEDGILAEEVMKITGGKGARLAFNSLTGPLVEEIIRSLSKGGTMFFYGGIGAHPTALPVPSIITNGITIRGYLLYEFTYHPENLDELRAYVSEGIENGDFKADVGHVFRFEEMVKAHEFLEAGNTAGSVVVLGPE